MSNLEYKSDLVITHYPSLKSDEKPEILSIPVHSFEVDGGANRKINLSSADEFSIATEFEQARIHTNFIFYIPPTKDFLAVKLINLSNTKGKHFNFSFSVSVCSGGKILRMLRVESLGAKFLETPVPIGNTPPLLMAKVRLRLPELKHGKRDEKQDHIVLENI